MTWQLASPASSSPASSIRAQLAQMSPQVDFHEMGYCAGFDVFEVDFHEMGYCAGFDVFASLT
jgi:hypothetical protein